MSEITHKLGIFFTVRSFMLSLALFYVIFWKPLTKIQLASCEYRHESRTFLVKCSPQSEDAVFKLFTQTFKKVLQREVGEDYAVDEEVAQPPFNVRFAVTSKLT
jgi:hypothetical protein